MPTVQTEPPVSNQPEAGLRKTLDGKKREETVLPDSIEATSFWSKIWSEEVGHNEIVSWLEDVELAFSTTEVQEDINITVEDNRTEVSKMANWQQALI